jgi:hypothetical protein
VSGSLAADLGRGALAGAVGWWAMDRVLRFCYDHQDPAARRAEDAARGGVPALEVAAERGAARADVSLSPRQRQAGGVALQWTFGVGAGVLYAALRRRFPAVGAGRGLAYGAAFSLVVDEGATPLLGFAPGPRAFPWQTHARGLLGHLVFGAVADAALRTLDPAAPALRNGGR